MRERSGLKSYYRHALLLHIQQYFKLRSNAVSALKEKGPHPYPHKFHVTLSLTAFIEQYQSLDAGEHHSDTVSVAGEECSVCVRTCVCVRVRVCVCACVCHYKYYTTLMSFRSVFLEH